MSENEKADAIVDRLQRQHGRVFESTLPTNELVVFRAATADDMKEWAESVEKKHPSSATRKQLAYRAVVYPRTDDPLTGLDAFKALIQRYPGVYNAAASELLTQAGNEVEFSRVERFVGGTPPSGAAMFGQCPDGEIVFIRSPSDPEWSRYQDGKASQLERGLSLAKAIFVGCAKLSFDDLHEKYPRLWTQMIDAGCDLIGATLQFTAKKG
jgi:hypothetical protein